MTSYARTEIAIIIFVGLLLTSAVAHVAGWWALLPAALTIAVLTFFRDPQRTIPADPRLLMAPADGRVVSIERQVADPAGNTALRIMIFLSVLDVHLNRSPCAGRVTALDYHPGEFLNALNPAANQRNECNTVTLKPAEPIPGPVQVRQIAGILARRIVCAANINDTLAAGQRFGMIKLGSRTELTVPEDPRWEVLATVGQHVSAGASPLLRLKEST